MHLVLILFIIIWFLPKYRGAFILAHFSMLPFALLSGRFTKPWVYEQLRLCGVGAIGPVDPVLLYCNLYRECRESG